MKTFKEFLDEALAASLVKAAARGLMRSSALRSAAKVASKPRRISLGNIVYHGTTQPASRAISRSGWRTDVNVTRQMGGQGVYVTPQRNAAQMYANQRSLQRGEFPSIRQFRIPANLYKKAKENRQNQGNWTFDKGGVKFNALQMSPKAANKFDITDRPQSNVFRLSPKQKKELKTRVSAGLSKPQNREQLKKEIESAIKTRQQQSLSPQSSQR